jgi:hypothetical protein
VSVKAFSSYGLAACVLIGLISCSPTALLFELQQQAEAESILDRTFIVSFDSQGGTAANPASKSVVLGEPYGVLPVSSRTDYAFHGWWTGPNAAGANVGTDTLVSVGSDHTVFADWVTPGSTWTERSLPSDPDWWSVVYGNGIYIAAPEYGSQAAVSTDGENWTLRKIQNDDNGEWVIAYGNELFVTIIGGDDIAVTSSDGVLWTEQPLGKFAEWTSITYGEGKFVAIAKQLAFDAASVSSADGTTWTSGSLVNRDWGSVAYGEGEFVALARNSNVAARSVDGNIWTEYDLPSTQNWSDISYGNGVFVAIAHSSDVAATSTNGWSWTNRSMPNTRQWNTITFGNGHFVALAEGSNIAATSTDGINWTEYMLPKTRDWQDIAYGDGGFIAISNVIDGMLTSP